MNNSGRAIDHWNRAKEMENQNRMQEVFLALHACEAKAHREGLKGLQHQARDARFRVRSGGRI